MKPTLAEALGHKPRPKTPVNACGRNCDPVLCCYRCGRPQCPSNSPEGLYPHNLTQLACQFPEGHTGDHKGFNGKTWGAE